jgi:hypothetical protein
VAVITSVISQTTITESTEQVNLKIKNNIRKKLPEKASLEPSSKDRQRRRSLYIQWQCSKKEGRQPEMTGGDSVEFVGWDLQSPVSR